jgi:hypothetical protein
VRRAVERHLHRLDQRFADVANHSATRRLLRRIEPELVRPRNHSSFGRDAGDEAYPGLRR